MVHRFSFLAAEGKHPLRFLSQLSGWHPAFLFGVRRGLTFLRVSGSQHQSKVGRLTHSRGSLKVEKGLIIIGTDRKPKGRINWHKIRAEYVAGVSQAKLAKKYHVSRTTVANHCRKEKWSESRENAKAEVEQKIIQKTAEVAADNATLAAQIKRKLLIKLDMVLDSFPDDEATEIQKFKRSERKVYKLRDLTAAYKDLTSDMAQTDDAGSELLQSLLDLERRVDHG